MYEILGLKHVFSTFQETVWSHLKLDSYMSQDKVQRYEKKT